MQRSSSSRSKRRCRRTVAPAAAAASRFNSPRMCDGGVATWKRSSWPSPSAVTQCAVPRSMDRWVWRTALGRSVVPELKTKTASSVSLHGDRRGRRVAGAVDHGGGARRRRGRGRRPRRAARPAGRRPARRRRRSGARSGRRAVPTSSAFQDELSMTGAAPTLLAAWTVTTNSGRFDVMTATRSPRPTPRSPRCCASALAARSSSP